MENLMDNNLRENSQEVDLTSIYVQLKDKHRNVYLHQFGDQVFFYRSIGRKEYKIITEDQEMNDFQKENVICDLCTLYPKNLDWNNMDAGIPQKLAELIIKNSFLDSIEVRQNLLGYYRAEMYDLDNQISCLINEAFPQFDLEEIEEWDVDKTTKYLSRAEWKLHNLRGLQFVQQEEQPYGTSTAKASPQQEHQIKQQDNNSRRTSEKTIRGEDKRTSKLTPEKIKEMEEFAKKFPEFDVFNDNVLKEGIDGMRGESTESGPLKTPNMW